MLYYATRKADLQPFYIFDDLIDRVEEQSKGWIEDFERTHDPKPKKNNHQTGYPTITHTNTFVGHWPAFKNQK